MGIRVIPEKGIRGGREGKKKKRKKRERRGKKEKKRRKREKRKKKRKEGDNSNGFGAKIGGKSASRGANDNSSNKRGEIAQSKEGSNEDHLRNSASS